LLFVTKVHLGARESRVARDDVGSGPGSGCRGEGEQEVGDLTLIGEGCQEPLRGDRVHFPRGIMSGDMDPVGGNGPVEVPDPEDSSTMEESVVTFSGQRHREPLVGDVVSSPESVVLGGENARDSVAIGDMCRLGGMGLVKMWVGFEDWFRSEGDRGVFSGAGYGRPPLGC